VTELHLHSGRRPQYAAIAEWTPKHKTARNFIESLEIMREEPASNIFLTTCFFYFAKTPLNGLQSRALPVGKGITMAGVLTPSPTPAYEYTNLKS
jgi:hypothetical protein